LLISLLMRASKRTLPKWKKIRGPGLEMADSRRKSTWMKRIFVCLSASK
jgi:hypothetical protein